MNNGQQHRYRIAAPVRLDLAGGWTDVAPFASEEGGAVVNTAIDLQARVTVTTPTERLRLHCLDSRVTSTWHDGAWDPDAGTTLAFQQAALRHTKLTACEITTASDVPRGSGLGGSGALGVALLAAADAVRGVVRSPLDLAEDAFDFEAREAAIPGGRQDQYAAALGGWNHLAFSAAGTTATKLTLDPAFTEALLSHLVVCYTGASRVSGSTIARVMGAYQAGHAPVTEALRALVLVAHEMTDALLAADLARVGALLSRNWQYQQALDPQMQTSAMAALEAAMIPAGVIGAKAAGAGAGGSMIFLVRDRSAARHAARACGATVLPFTWATAGVSTEQA